MKHIKSTWNVPKNVSQPDDSFSSFQIENVLSKNRYEILETKYVQDEVCFDNNKITERREKVKQRKNKCLFVPIVVDLFQ